MRCARAFSEGLDQPASAIECLAEALILEPSNSAVRAAVDALRTAHPETLVVHDSILSRLRRRQAQRQERGQEREAAAYGEALALLPAATL